MKPIVIALAFAFSPAALLGAPAFAKAAPAAPATQSTTVTFNVDGMHCSGCSTKIEEEVKKVAGVSKVVVDLEKKTATVTFDAGKTKSDAIKDAIAKAGYKPTLAA